jgi:predicted nucleic acid binding AN1-type Zn finger protein
VSTIERCAADVSTWCASKRLQLNGNKTEVMWFGTPAGLRKIPPQAGSIHVDHSVVEPVSAVRDLGVIVDAELTMQEHVNRTAQTCFYHLRRLRSVRQQLGRDVTAQLVSALVLSRLDYCNAVLADLPASTLAPFQKVLHAAARLVLGLRPRDHVSSALKELHWLPIMQRIQYKLCLFVHKASIGQAPKYIIDLLTANADVPSKSSLRSSDSGNYVLPRTRTKLGHRAFSVAAPRAWNCLPTELKLQRSTTVFRRDLKTFLFKAAYG